MSLLVKSCYIVLKSSDQEMFQNACTSLLPEYYDIILIILSIITVGNIGQAQQYALLSEKTTTTHIHNNNNKKCAIIRKRTANKSFICIIKSPFVK